MIGRLEEWWQYSFTLVTLPRDHTTQELRGFGYVLFKEEAGALKAIEEVDGKVICKNIDTVWQASRER